MKKYLIFADLHVSITKLMESGQTKQIYLKLYNKGKSFMVEGDFDSLIKLWNEKDEESILSMEEVEKMVKSLIDLAVSDIPNITEYDRNLCSVSSAIYYRLICIEEPMRFDIVPATINLESYFTEQFSKIDRIEQLDFKNDISPN